MKKIEVAKLTGVEVLSRDILTESGIVLIPEGSVLKKAYIEKLIELNIFYAYIEDSDSKDKKSQEQQTIEDCTNKVKSLIEKHFYSNNSELSRMSDVAEEIILETLNSPEVIMNVNNMRHNSEDLYIHSVNVCAVAVLIALTMKIPATKVKDIAIGALLHDIGYSYAKASLRNMRKNVSCESETREMKKHVVYGYSIIENEKWLSDDAKDIILSHHEREDGSGYPFKRTGNNIKLGTKIVAVADEFDNIINGKNSEVMKVYMAIDMIVCQGGKIFDINVISAFRDSVAAYPTGTVVVTNNKEIGVVISQNAKCPTRPVLKIIRDKDGNEINRNNIRDLTKELTIFIDDTIE